jgi:hypothetical protein
MAKKVAAKESVAAPRLKPSALLDTRVVYCGDNLEQLAKLPDAGVDLIYIDPPFNSNRNYEVFWGSPREITPRATTSHRLHRISRGETKEKRAFGIGHQPLPHRRMPGGSSRRRRTS